MKLVQPGSLNRYVDASIPLTWTKRWEDWRAALPIIVFCGVVFLPFLSLMALIEQSWEPMQRAVIPLLILPLFILFVIEIETRLSQRSKRTLRIKNMQIEFHSYNKARWVQWSEVAAVRFEPILDAADHCVTLIEFKSRNGKTGRPWSLVLPWNDVKSSLVPELNRQKEAHRSEFVFEFREKRSKERPRVRLPMLWFLALSMLLLVYGLPLFGLGVIGLARGGDGKSAKTEKVEGRGDQKSKFSPEAEERLGRFLAKNIGSVERLSQLFLCVGGVLIIGSLASSKYEFRRIDRATRM